MAETDKGTAIAAGIGGVALVTAAIALAQKRVAKAAPGGEGAISLDSETMQLLIAMAQTTADIEQLVDRILGSLGGLGGSGGVNLQVQGYPPNTETITATRVQIVAINTFYELPDIVVPEGMVLQFKGWPTNAGLIYVGYSRATVVNINQVWPLLANEAIGYAVKNTDGIYISGTVAGDWCVMTVEQRGSVR